MRNKYTRKVTKQVNESYGLKITCDICGKVICDFDATPPRSSTGESAEYFALTTGHHDWGNDSPDSIENIDICSDDCVKIALIDYLNESKGSTTAYFQLSKGRACKWKDPRTGEVFYYER